MAWVGRWGSGATFAAYFYFPLSSARNPGTSCLGGGFLMETRNETRALRGPVFLTVE